MLRRLGDRGEGPISYLAVILLVASIVAAVTVVAIPEKVTGGISWAVCRVMGSADCERPGGGDDGGGRGGHPSPSTGAGAETPAPASAPAVPGLPGTPEQQAYDQAKQRADAAGAKTSDLSGQVKDAGLELLKFLSELIGIEDAKKCVLEGDIAACLWTLVGIMPWGKAFKLLKRIPAAVKLGKRLKELWDAIAAARKEKQAADAALKEAEKALAKKKADEALALCKKPNSFAAGTRVLLADGRRRRIEDVRVGDLVWATDPGAGRSGPGRVTDLITGSGTEHLTGLTIDPDGRPGGRTARITATAGHPFWSPDRHAWREAGDLAAGDRLATANGATALITSVRRHTRSQRVYNLTVSGAHTYYVAAGNEDVLVHNAGAPVCQTPAEIDRKLDDALKSADPDKQLEGQLGRRLRSCLTQFGQEFPAAGSVGAGEIDVGTPGAIVEVYNGTKSDLDGKSKQMSKYKAHPDINPGGERQVFVLAPNVSELDRARFAKDNGVRVFGSIDHLVNHLRRIGAC